MDNKTTNSKRNYIEPVKEFFKKDLVQYIVKRLLMFIPTLFLISVLAFFVIQLPEKLLRSGGGDLQGEVGIVLSKLCKATAQQREHMESAVARRISPLRDSGR